MHYGREGFATDTSKIESIWKTLILYKYIYFWTFIVYIAVSNMKW